MWTPQARQGNKYKSVGYIKAIYTYGRLEWDVQLIYCLQMPASDLLQTHLRLFQSLLFWKWSGVKLSKALLICIMKFCKFWRGIHRVKTWLWLKMQIPCFLNKFSRYLFPQGIALILKFHQNNCFHFSSTIIGGYQAPSIALTFA